MNKLANAALTTGFSLFLSFGVVSAWTWLQAQPGDTLQLAKWNELVARTEPKYVQLESQLAQSFASNTWTPVSFENAPANSGFSFSTTNITFPEAGAYKVTLWWRMGGGGDVWSQVRLYGDGASKGHSSSFGNIATNDPTQNQVEFIAVVTNPAATYQIQIWRLSSALGVVAPNSIASEPTASFQATITKP